MPPDETHFGISYPLGFLARTAALLALSCALGLLILWWIFSQDLGPDYAPAFYTIKNLIDFLVPALVFSGMAVLLVASATVFVVAVFASHKIAGPLFRLQRVAGYLGRRTLVGRIHLRSADQGKAVAGTINAWVARRKERLAALQIDIAACEETLKRCEESVERADFEKLPQLLEVFRGHVTTLRYK